MRWKLLAGLVGIAVLLAALAVLGLDHGWWRLNHPDPSRFPVWGVDVYRGDRASLDRL